METKYCIEPEEDNTVYQIYTFRGENEHMVSLDLFDVTNEAGSPIALRLATRSRELSSESARELAAALVLAANEADKETA